MKQLIICSFFVLAGCAGLTGDNIACTLRDADPEVTGLMEQSCGGDQYASFQLGDIYQRRAEDNDSEADWSNALNFYRIAALTNSGQTFIYVPGAGKVSGYTMPVQTGNATLGVAEAQFRLGQMYLYGKGVVADRKTALRYLKMAEAQGHGGALLLQQRFN